MTMGFFARGLRALHSAFEGLLRRIAPGLVAVCVLAAGCGQAPPPASQAAPDRAASEQAAFELPAFPWPPPAPSARLALPRSMFAGVTHQFGVAERLSAALDRAGYSERSFYRAPGGFALVARLERMRDDGTPAPEDLRFLQPGAEEPFSLTAYVQRLFFAPAGYYRQIVFVASDKPFTPDPSAQMTADAATTLLRGGADRLPDAFRSFPFGASHQVTALIYEFRKGAQDRDVATLDPGRLPGRTHLERAGILAALEASK